MNNEDRWTGPTALSRVLKLLAGRFVLLGGPPTPFFAAPSLPGFPGGDMSDVLGGCETTDGRKS